MMKNKSYLNETSDSQSIKDIILRYLSKWYWFVLGAIVCLLMAHIYLRYAVREYSASATIMVKDDKKGGMISELATLDMDVTGKIKSTVDNEIEIIRSRTIAEYAVRDLNLNIRYFSEGRLKTIELYKESPVKIIFSEPVSKSIYYKIETIGDNSYNLFDAEDTLLGRFTFGQRVDHSNVSFTVIQNRQTSSERFIIITANTILATAQSFKNKINVRLVDDKTSVVELSIVDAVRDRAEDVLNAVIHNYNRDAIKDKSQIFENTSRFINERLELIAGELGDVERSGEAYKKSNQVTDIVSEAGIFLKNATEFERAFIETETQLRVVASLREFVVSSSKTDLIPDNILTTMSADANYSPTLISEYNELLLERQRKIKSAGPENRIIKELDAQLASLKQNIIANLDRLKNTLTIKKNDLAQQQSRISGKISEVPTQEREYKGIVRQQNIKEQLYMFLLQKREETAIALASTAPNAKIIDSALTASMPVSPRTNIIYLAALFMGCFIPFGIIYVSDLLDTKIHSHSDLNRLSVPYLGDVPKAETSNEIITLHSRTSTAEALRIIRTNLEFMLSHIPDGIAKTIFVTSTIPKEGKTFVSINLAATIALSGKKTLLLAMDIRNPKFDDYLDIPAKGLTNYLATPNSKTEDYIVKHDTHDNFYIFPAGVIPPNPAELLMDARVAELFTKLQKEYEYIVVDTAPVSLVTDTQIIAKFAHSFVYVTRANHLDKNMLSIPQRLYSENKLPNMSMLLNDTDLKKGYGYGYGHGYGYEKAGLSNWYRRFFKRKKR